MADTDSVTGHTCETEGCDKEARLQCPTCLKQGIEGSYFCSQECFKGSWSKHKAIHKKTKKQNEVVVNNNVWPGYSFTGSVRKYNVTKMRTVPESIPRPDYATHPQGIPITERQFKGSIKALTDEEIEDMRTACHLGRDVLDIAAEAIGVGVTTEEIDRLVHEACVDRECYPSPLNYHQFPKSCCTSVNEVICHGIPDMRPLQDGDICNVDITVYYRGYHGDLNETFFVGNVDEASKKLVQTTYECLSHAIDMVKPGVRYRDIGNVIQKHAQAHGYSVVRTYCGHGINQLFHTAPSVPHYARNKAVGVMKPGHTFTIEPMISAGTWRDKLWPDDWTAVTEDGKRSAQFEQTLLVTDGGVEILTARRTNGGKPWFMDQM